MEGRPLPKLSFRKVVVSSAQEDVFVPTQSVWEALLFYTQLSLPGDLSMTQRQERMNSVLRTMGLEKVKNSKVLLPFTSK
jgi:ABC-type multidrug transport system ATPase subunit